MPHGRLPEQLPPEITGVTHLEVTCPREALRKYTLIDTPGLATLDRVQRGDDPPGRPGERASGEAAGEADALLYLVKAATVRTMSSSSAPFTRRRVPGRRLRSTPRCPVACRRVRRPGTGVDDPFEKAQRLAARLSRAHAAELAVVVPVSGRLAQSARTGLIGEDRHYDWPASATCRQDNPCSGPATRTQRSGPSSGCSACTA